MTNLHSGFQPRSAIRSPSFTGSRNHRLLVAAAAILWIVLAPGAAQAVDIKQTAWGFDGQIVAQRFNLFSVLVDNPSANSFEGTIRLKKLVAGKQVDALVVETVYLAPFSSRWVQFYPYIKSDWDNWEISWAPAATSGSTASSERGSMGSFIPPTARFGVPAAVLLEDPDVLAQGGGTIKRLHDNLFPAHSTATDCLAAVVLDHVPRWDTARQHSFLEWLNRGGRVYLLQTQDGKPLEFTGELQVLNAAGDERRIGSGTVYRIDRKRRQLDALFVEKVIAGKWKPPGGETLEPTIIETPVSTNPDQTNQNPAVGYQRTYYKWEVEPTILAQLKRISNPEHSWALFFLLGLVYLGMLCPGCYAIGQKYGGDYRKTFGFLLGTVGVFSVIFLYIGRRGYNEVTVVHSLAVANQQPGGNLDVTQWSNAFVVGGGDYTLAHAGTGRIYSTCQDQEPVRGEIRNGPDAHLLADIPPFSSRPFSHRALVPGRPLDVTVEDWTTRMEQAPVTVTTRDLQRAVLRPQRALSSLKLRKGKEFPTAAKEVMRDAFDKELQSLPCLYVLYGRNLHRLKETKEHLVLDSLVGPLASVLQTDKYSEFGVVSDPWGSSAQFGWQRRRDRKGQELFEGMFYVLLARSLELADQKEVEEFSLPSDRARLLVFSPLPDKLKVTDQRFGRQDGYVLYCLDVFEPGVFKPEQR